MCIRDRLYRSHYPLLCPHRHSVNTQGSLYPVSYTHLDVYKRQKYTYKKIWLIAYPILISLLMEQMIGMTDTAFLGRVGERCV